MTKHISKIKMYRKHSNKQNCLIVVLVLALVSSICFLFERVVPSDFHVPLLFVLAVLFISRFTDGYAYGIAASVIAVFEVNYLFTYPYREFDFTLSGYPITFCVMLTVAICVSALTTQIKNQEKIRLEVEKEKMRGNLLRAVSHDLRTPLTSIVGSASVIIDNDDKLPKEKKMELVRDIKEEAQWLIRIVENLLSVTRINGENAKINMEEELVEEIVSSAVIKFKKRFSDVKVTVEIPQEVFMVPMDGILIEQVMINLMENSVVHGGKITEIRVRIRQEKDKVEFIVEDDGDGIDAAVLPVMFEGSLQASEGKESDGKKNMGIGLSVCKTIVKAHKGNMKAENRPEGGARVMFSLPMGVEESYGDKR